MQLCHKMVPSLRQHREAALTSLPPARREKIRLSVRQGFPITLDLVILSNILAQVH